MRNTGNLTVSLPGDCEIQLTRVFNAPRALVHEAFSTPAILTRWFGPKGWTMTECSIDLRVGGGFRFVMRSPEGKQLGMTGRYLELDPPGRTVHVESFDEFPGEARVTTVLTEADGRTTLVATLEYPSREVRDAVIRSGMEHGAAESYDRLEEVLR